MALAKHEVHADHEHQHGPGCGHVAVPHEDHTDYVHDGHIHRELDGQWVECETEEQVAHEDHDHEHGPGCGHVAIPHGDHVDYVHDGHRHAFIDGKWVCC